MARPTKTGRHGLYRDARGRYCVDLRWVDARTGEARRYRKRFPVGLSAAAAKQQAADLLNSAHAGTLDEERDAPHLVCDSFDEYIKHCETDSPNYLEKRKASVARLVASLGAAKRLDAVGALDVQRAKRDRKATKGRGTKVNMADATVNRDLAVLGHAFGRFAEWGWVPDAVARDVRKAAKPLREPAGRVRHLSQDEESRLLAALPARSRHVVQAALLSGMRQSEVLTLKKSAVDLDAGVITLTRTKSGKVRRVYIHPALAEILRGSMAESDKDTEYVFTSRKGTPYTGDGLRAIFQRACKRAGITNFRFHDTRHTCATRLRQAGVGAEILKETLGHASYAMVDRYAHIEAATMLSAMAKLPAPAKPPPEASVHLARVPQNDAQPLPNTLRGRVRKVSKA